MNSYFQYLTCALVALTHKKIALVILAVTEPTHTLNVESIMRIAVLIITGLGALLRIYLDWKNRNKN